MRASLTHEWRSGNVTIWEEYRALAFVVANSAILLITFSVGIAANIFVILAVCGQKSLQTSTNALVVNLAVIDLLRCLIDCPVLLTIVITGHQRGRGNHLVCDTQVASFSFSCCIQLLTLACISAERYQAIAQPFKTSRRRRRIMVLIPATWILAIVVAVFCLMFVKDSPVHMRCKGLHGQNSYDSFGLYILFPLWAACFAVIIGFYARIFLLVRSHNRKIFDKGVHPSRTDKGSTKQENGQAVEGCDKCERKQSLSKSVEQVRPETLSLTNSSVKDLAVLVTSAEAPRCDPDGSGYTKDLEKKLAIMDLEGEEPPSTHVSVQSQEKTTKTEKLASSAKKVEAIHLKGDAVAGDESSSTKPQKVSSISDTEKQSKEGAQIHETPSEVNERSPHGASSALANPETTFREGTKKQGSEEPSPAAPAQPASLPVPAVVSETEAPTQNTDVEGPVCMMPSTERRERASKNKESKMAKRAGYIILTFLLFWLPLIATILGNFMTEESQSAQVSGCWAEEGKSLQCRALHQAALCFAG